MISPWSLIFARYSFRLVADASRSSTLMWSAPGNAPVPISIASSPAACTRFKTLSNESLAKSGVNTPSFISRRLSPRVVCPPKCPGDCNTPRRSGGTLAPAREMPARHAGQADEAGAEEQHRGWLRHFHMLANLLRRLLMRRGSRLRPADENKRTDHENDHREDTLESQHAGPVRLQGPFPLNTV